MWIWKNRQRYMNTEIWETNDRNVNSDFVTRSLTSSYQPVCWREAKVPAGWRGGQPPRRRKDVRLDREEGEQGQDSHSAKRMWKPEFTLY